VGVTAAAGAPTPTGSAPPSPPWASRVREARQRGQLGGRLEGATPDALDAAIARALRFDTKVLMEPASTPARSRSPCSATTSPQASIPGEIVVHHADGFYSYDAKYVDPTAATGRSPPSSTTSASRKLRGLAVETFRALELSGMARVDFFLDRDDGALYVNEVNTIPGFTAISMYPKMWEATGLPATALVTRLIELAIERRAARRALKTSI
jgi:D-alanine-D-alanine ligase